MALAMTPKSMSKKVFDKIAEGLHEVLAIARGEAKPARLFVPPARRDGMEMARPPVPVRFGGFIELIKLPPLDVNGFSLRLEIGMVGSVFRYDQETNLFAVHFSVGDVWLSEENFQPCEITRLRAENEHLLAKQVDIASLKSDEFSSVFLRFLPFGDGRPPTAQ
jgi:hypothetical protein